MSYLFLALFWSLWCALHSLMISRALVIRLKKRYGDRFRYFRVIFNLVSIVTLIPVLLYSHYLRGIPLFNWTGVWRPVQFSVGLCALALFYAGSRHYDLEQFMGIRQVVEHESAKGLTKTGTLDTSGILGVIRHPWYTASILIIWVRPLDMAAIVTNAVLTAYLVIGTFLEERKLVAAFGEAYKEYQKKVPMFIPGSRNISNSNSKK